MENPVLLYNNFEPGPEFRGFVDTQISSVLRISPSDAFIKLTVTRTSDWQWTASLNINSINLRFCADANGDSDTEVLLNVFENIQRQISRWSHTKQFNFKKFAS